VCTNWRIVSASHAGLVPGENPGIVPNPRGNRANPCYAPRVGYFIRRGKDAAKGPYPASLLRRLAESGRIKATDEVMPEGATRWYRAWRITDFGLSRPEATAVNGTAGLCAVGVATNELTRMELEPPPLLATDHAGEALVGECLVEEGPEGMPRCAPAEHSTHHTLRLVREEAETLGVQDALGRPAMDPPSHGAMQPPEASRDSLLRQTMEIQGVREAPEPGERLVGTVAQDATDLLVCGWGAFLRRRRGAVIATNKRFLVCRPRGAGMERHSIELARVSRVAIEHRLVWRRVGTVSALTMGALLLGGWAILSRAPMTFPAAVEGAVAFGCAASLSLIACLLAGRMRYPSLVLRLEGHSREWLDLPCQLADRHVVRGMASLLRRVDQHAAAHTSGSTGTSVAVARTETEARPLELQEIDSTSPQPQLEPSGDAPRAVNAHAGSGRQWTDVSAPIPLEEYLKNRAAS